MSEPGPIVVKPETAQHIVRWLVEMHRLIYEAERGPFTNEVRSSQAREDLRCLYECIAELRAGIS